jgi:CRISPR/Cas system-associated protein endoribonuclease Cas2
MPNTNSVVAVFESHDQAEDAIRELQEDGFAMKKLSIVARITTRKSTSSATTPPATA